jgi:hypothetical protein
MVDRDRPLSEYQGAKWRDLVREARGRIARRAEGARDKRAREELDMFTENEHQIRNAMGEIMFSEFGIFRPLKRFHDSVDAAVEAGFARHKELIPHIKWHR